MKCAAVHVIGGIYFTKVKVQLRSRTLDLRISGAESVLPIGIVPPLRRPPQPGK